MYDESKEFLAMPAHTVLHDFVLKPWTWTQKHEPCTTMLLSHALPMKAAWSTTDLP